ncbi:hypothetical protein SAMN05444671_2321 [Flavobacterium sp. CF108]|uniref:hypothetical protein n=1 Tax=unclassified Flavobacterium TaxID=196869 RepID=UPI0008C4DE48|nr:MULTISPECIES: hypothetical protein [unclassified Flavobacterium]SEN87502.1 hypothetical protein SAMN04487978_1637 [Flavobacterium sp. fv08]SHH22679.1 hypothetical protein SAMN05444671_2321 [Flavobacterium sp. CF108]
MDILGFVFLIVLLIMITILNLLFIKNLKNNNKNQIRHKLIFVLISIVLLALVITFYLFIQNAVLIDLMHLDIDDITNGGRVITLLIIILLNSILNIFISRIYLRKINKTNEIELIGKE